MVCLHESQNNGEFSDLFPVTNGVKQGCVLAPTLFSMMFSAILTAAFQDGNNGIPIRYRFVGKLSNLRKLQVKPKLQTEVLDMQRELQQKRRCKKVSIKFLTPVTIMTSQ